MTDKPRSRSPRKTGLPPEAAVLDPERAQAEARMQAAREEAVSVLADIASRVQAEGEAKEALLSVIEALSPDDARAVHQALVQAAARPMPRNPDLELAGDWRGGAIPTGIACCARTTKSRNTACRSSCSSCKPGSRPPGSVSSSFLKGGMRPARAARSNA